MFVQKQFMNGWMPWEVRSGVHFLSQQNELVDILASSQVCDPRGCFIQLRPQRDWRRHFSVELRRFFVRMRTAV